MSRAWPLTLRGTGALVLALGSFAAANQLGLVELVWFGVLLLALVAACGATMLVARRRADVSRTFAPATPVAGTEIDVVARVVPTSGLPAAAGRWHDDLPEGLEGAAEGVFPAVASGLARADRTVELAYRVTARRRGIHWVGPLELSATDPFGIVRRTVALGDLTRIVVTPAVVDLPAVPGLSGRIGGSLPASTDRIGQGADDLVARPYAPGDSMRRIHWRASAHRDELMVRQEEQETAPEATVVLDRAVARWSPEAMETTGADPDFEAAVTACASVLVRLVREGFAVDVVDTDGTPLCGRVEGADAVALDEAMLALATVTATLDDRLHALVSLFAGTTTGPLVVVTGRLSGADAALLAPVGHHSSFPLLLAAAPERDALAHAAGWLTARIGADADLAEAWESATAWRAGGVRA